MRYIILALLFIFTTEVDAFEVQAVNHTGSYSGAFNLGLSISPDSNVYRCELLAGYTPGLLAGEDLYSITNKHTAIPAPHWLIRPYSGLGIIFSVMDNDTFHVLPDHYPRRYYPPTGHYFMPFMGLEAGPKDFNVYFEVATLDYYLEMYHRSGYMIDPYEIFTYGFGVRSRIH